MDPSTPEARSGGALPHGVLCVREEVRDDGVPVATHPGWKRRFPWLIQGVTWRGRASQPFDLALFGSGEHAASQARWEALREATGAVCVHHAQQVHGTAVHVHQGVAPGLLLSPPADGHVTRSSAALLAVTVADCIPILLVDEARRAVGALHGGWRGLASGIVESGLQALRERFGSRPLDISAHLGPAICGDCYQVGPEVHEALGLQLPSAPTPVDLRGVAATRAVAAGVPAAQVTVSAWCTHCQDSPFFSHRRGDRQRQAGFVGVAP